MSNNIVDANMILFSQQPKLSIFSQRATPTCIFNFLPHSEMATDYSMVYQACLTGLRNKAYAFLNITYNLDRDAARFFNHFKYLEGFVVDTDQPFRFNAMIESEMAHSAQESQRALQAQKRREHLDRSLGSAAEWAKLLQPPVGGSQHRDDKGASAQARGTAPHLR